MIILLLIVTLLLISCILVLGDYNTITFSFIVASIILPPLFLKYRNNPHRSIYVFFILWIVFPKYIRYLPLIGTYDLLGFSYFDILQAIAIFHIVYLLIVKGYKHISALQMPKTLKMITRLFIITIFSTTIFGGIRYFFFVPENEQFEIGNLLEAAFSPYTGVIFFIGLFAFIVQYKQVENLLFILAIGGILLLLEHLLLVELQLFQALKVFAYAEDQVRFSSIMYGSYDVKGIFCAISALAILYFAISKKKYYLILFVILMILPISLTYQRTPYLGYFLALTIFCIRYFVRISLFSRSILFSILLMSILIVSFYQKSSYNYMNNYVTGDQTITRELNQTQSFYDRYGLWIRAVDVFMYSFPFGIGNGMYEIYSGQRFAPDYASSLLDSRSKSSYQSLKGYHRTKAHNVFLQFLAEYNILGLIVLYFFVKQILVYMFVKLYKHTEKINNLYRATIIGMVFGIGVMSLFDSALQLYFLYGLILFFASFIAKSGSVHKETNYKRT